MTNASEELRRMLDERGVKWRKTPHYSSESQDNETVFEGTGIEWYANDHLNGRLGLRTARYEVTPEQAVEATLGETPTPPQPTPPKQPPYDELIESLRRDWGIEASWDGLRKFWYLGWTDEHVEDMGRLHDELRDAIVELLGDRCGWVQTGVTHAHNVLDKASHAGRGTCRMERVDDEQRILHGWLECSECGPVYPPAAKAIQDAIRFCPYCGRRVVK